MNLRKALLALAVVVTLAVLHLGIYTHNINLKYEVEEKKRTHNVLRRDLRYYSSIVARKKDLQRIENIAKNKLGMIRPKKINYIRSSTEEVSP